MTHGPIGRKAGARNQFRDVILEGIDQIRKSPEAVKEHKKALRGRFPGGPGGHPTILRARNASGRPTKELKSRDEGPLTRPGSPVIAPLNPGQLGPLVSPFLASQRPFRAGVGLHPSTSRSALSALSAYFHRFV